MTLIVLYRSAYERGRAAAREYREHGRDMPKLTTEPVSLTQALLADPLHPTRWQLNAVTLGWQQGVADEWHGQSPDASPGVGVVVVNWCGYGAEGGCGYICTEGTDYCHHCGHEPVEKVGVVPLGLADDNERG